MKIPDDIRDIILNARNIALFTHVHPDGDAVGSLLGFSYILENLGKNVFCYLEEPVPYLYDFLPGCEKVSTSMTELEAFLQNDGEVAAISLDCGDRDRLGRQKDQILQISPFIVIDHHRSHKDFGMYRWVDPDRSSTGEMVFELAGMLGADINSPCAYNLYVAISTDTGSFRYEATTSRTMRIAAELIDLGVNPDEVSGKIHNNYTLERLRLMEMVLGTLTLYASGKIALINVSRQMFDKSGALPEDVDGFIDFPRSISSVKVAAFIKEGENGKVAVSLRAKGECDVAKIAKLYGGGGHRNASGFRFADKSVEEVRQLVKSTLTSALEE